MNIFLVGFMGSGKSTTGKWLANRLDYKYIDLDHYIEKKAGQSVSSIFSTGGEIEFRKFERKALIELTSDSRVVIATGGGTPCFFDNMDIMNRSGKTVYLDLPVEYLLERLVNEKDHRPLISGLNKKELRQFINDKLEEREIYYRKAQIVIKGDQIDLEDLLTLLI